MKDDGMLSQEEIDALLNATNDSDSNDETEIDETDYLTSIEKDTLGEIGNISFGSSATTLSTLLNQKVEITTPAVTVIKKTELLSDFASELVSVEVRYVEGFTGQNVFVIKAMDAAIISDIMLGGDGTNPDTELTEIHLSAVQEAMNQMMGAAATSMSTIFNKKIDISPPIIKTGEQAKQASAESIEEEIFVQVSFNLKVGDLIDSQIMQIIPFPFANELVDELLHPKTEHEAGDNTQESSIEELEEIVQSEVAALPELEQQNDTNANTEANKPPVVSKQVPERSESVANTTPSQIGSIVASNANIQQATFSEFEDVSLNTHERQNLDMLLDIPLQVTVELGRTERTIRDILDLSAGSIIELDKLAGEPVDVFVNKKLIAKGEVVVIEENFGVRVTDIISQADRIMNLK